MEVLLTLKLPLSVQVSHRKKFILNLNNYRNAHYRVLSKAKREYAKIVYSLLTGAKKLPEKKLRFTYIYFAKTRRRIDIANPCSIIDKFTSDALVDKGLIEDDDIKTLPMVKYVYGGIDPQNPRCELKITLDNDNE